MVLYTQMPPPFLSMLGIDHTDFLYLFRKELILNSVKHLLQTCFDLLRFKLVAPRGGRGYDKKVWDEIKRQMRENHPGGFSERARLEEVRHRLVNA